MSFILQKKKSTLQIFFILSINVFVQIKEILQIKFTSTCDTNIKKYHLIRF